MGMVCFSSPGQMNALEVWYNNVLTTTVVSYKSLIHQPVRRPVVIEAGPFDPDFQGCSLGGYTNKPAVTGFPVTVPILGEGGIVGCLGRTGTLTATEQVGPHADRAEENLLKLSVLCAGGTVTVSYFQGMPVHRNAPCAGRVGSVAGGEFEFCNLGRANSVAFNPDGPVCQWKSSAMFGSSGCADNPGGAGDSRSRMGFLLAQRSRN